MLISTNILTFLAGARRWFHKGTAIAAAAALGAVVLLLAGWVAVAAIYGAGGAASEAKVNWRWLQQLTAQNLKRAQEQARAQAAAAAAANAALEATREELRTQAERRIGLERALAALKDNPELYTLEERMRFFK